MSFDYFVTVPRAKWPTAAEVQACLTRLSYPLRLAEASAWPLLLGSDEFALATIFEGHAVGLEAEAVEVSDLSDPGDLFTLIAGTIAPRHLVAEGDYFLVLTFRSDPEQIRAGLFLAAAMIKCFGGYGFENQSESHGGADFAERLVAEARGPVFHRLLRRLRPR